MLLVFVSYGLPNLLEASSEAQRSDPAGADSIATVFHRRSCRAVSRLATDSVLVGTPHCFVRGLCGRRGMDDKRIDTFKQFALHASREIIRAPRHCCAVVVAFRSPLGGAPTGCSRSSHYWMFDGGIHRVRQRSRDETTFFDVCRRVELVDELPQRSLETGTTACTSG